MSSSPISHTLTLSRHLRLLDITVIGLGPMLAAGAFLLPGLVGTAAGWGTPLAYLLGGVVALLTALTYSELASTHPEAAGGYAWAREALSRPAGFGSGWLSWLALAASGSLFALGSGAWLADVFGHAIGTGGRWLPPALAVLAVLMVTAFNGLGLTQRGRTDEVVTFVVLGLLVLLAAVGATSHGGQPDWLSGLRAVAFPGVEALAGGAVAALMAFAGFEFIAQSSGETRNARRILPRAILLSLTATLPVFLAFGWAAVAAATAQGVAAWPVPGLPPATAVLDLVALLLPEGRMLILVAGLLSMLLALNSAVYAASRVAFAMGRDGNLPKLFGLVHPTRRTPLWAIGATGVLTAALAGLLPVEQLAAVIGLLFLLVFVLVNFAALRLRRGATEAGPGFRVPGFRLVPYVSVAVLLALAAYQLALNAPAWYWVLGWLLAGSGVYVGFVRKLELAERMPIVGADVAFERDYRVIMPVVEAQRVPLLATLARALAAPHDGEVLALHVEKVPAQLPVSTGRRYVEHGTRLLDEALAALQARGARAHTMLRLAHAPADAIRETAIETKASALILGWGGEQARSGLVFGSTLDPLLADPPCDLAVVRVREGNGPRRLLVPIAGGPHAHLAAEWAVALAEEMDGQVTALYVALAGSTPAHLAGAEGALREMLGPLSESPRVHTKVVTAPNVISGIAAEARTGYDLVMLGASREGVLDRLLFGDVPMRLAQQLRVPVMIVKRRAGAVATGVRWTWHWLTSRLPSLDAAAHVQVYREMRRGARPSADFFVLIGLSATIASLGLLLNSGAVIIGAMLVAPLMSPILASGLGLVRGDLRLLRVAGEATLKGILFAIGLSLVLGLLTPNATATAEILARTQPTLLDLGVALASGAAGAYAVSRKEVSAALPGVAIAAALVPPLATVGIGLALGRPDISIGALLLFTTNLIAISAAGAVIFLAFGFRPDPDDSARVLVLRRGFLGAGLLLVAVAVVLGVLTNRLVQNSRFSRVVQAAVAAEVSQIPEMTLEDARITGQSPVIGLELTVRTTRVLAHAEVVALQTRIATRLQRPVALVITLIPTTRLDPLVPPTLTPTATSTPTLTPGPSATPTFAPSATATRVPPSATASPTATATHTPTPSATFTATPLRAVIADTGGVGVALRDAPQGRIIGFLPEGAPVQVLNRREVVNRIEWVEVHDALDRTGWVMARFLAISP